jgi:hypothetical protein
MVWRIVGPERNIAPADFQDRLTLVGGVNKYDEPCFKIAWAQYETFIAGGAWSVDERYYLGYRRLLLGSGEPCWSILQWHASEEYGSPEAYYVNNYDETTGLQTLGEYPYSGRYEILYNLRWHTLIEGRIEFHTLPLNPRVFDVVAQIVLIAKDISVEKTRAAYLAAREAETAAKVADVERHLHDHHIPFSGGVSFTRQGIRSTVIDAKMRAMQQRWNQLAASAAQFSSKGMQTR